MSELEKTNKSNESNEAHEKKEVTAITETEKTEKTTKVNKTKKMNIKTVIKQPIVLMQKILSKTKRGVSTAATTTREKTDQFCKDKKLVTQPIDWEGVPAYSYFQQARNWADDFYASVEASRNRWKAAALWVLTPVSILLLLCTTMLIPAQHLVPLLVTHYQNGQVTVTPFHNAYTPKNEAEVKSNIARYVQFRESYSPDLYDYSYRLINIMSSANVRKVYQASQSSANKHSPINLLGNKGYRKVKILNIAFLDSADQNNPHSHDQPHHNVAEVDFEVINHSNKTGRSGTVPLSALVSWQYRGMPQNPENRWMNWNGFTVTSYTVQERNI